MSCIALSGIFDKVCKNCFWRKIQVVKISMIYEVMAIVTTMLSGNKFVFFSLIFIIMFHQVLFSLIDFEVVHYFLKPSIYEVILNSKSWTGSMALNQIMN